MYVICSGLRFVKISSPNECDKILKIPNESKRSRRIISQIVVGMLATAHIRQLIIIV